MAQVYDFRAVANGFRTDHPIPDLPFVDDSLLPLDDPDAIEAIGRTSEEGTWGRTDPCGDGWVAYTTDPKHRDLAWLVRFHPEHGRSVVLYRDEDASSAYMTYWEAEVLLFRAGGYWWNGTAWFRPTQVFDRSREVYLNRPVPAALTISAADLLDSGADTARGQVQPIDQLDPEASPYAAGGRRWRDDLAWWAAHHDGRHLAGCVVQLTAPELTADQLLGVAELAEVAGIGASTLRAYITREEGDVPLPQATVSGRHMWSRPVAEDWAEQRRRSGDGAQKSMADRDHSNLSTGVKQIWEQFTRAFVVDLWERSDFKKRFALRWRTQTAITEVARSLGWTVAASLSRIVPVGDLGHTIRAAVLWELAHWRRNAEMAEMAKTSGYPIAMQVTRMLDWLIRHDPDRAAVVVAEIVGEAERQLDISPKTAGRSLRQALSLDGKLADKAAYAEFLELALPPED